VGDSLITKLEIENMNNKFLTVVVGTLLVLNTGISFAEEAKKAEQGPSPAVIEQIDIANKLIALGDARKDPLLLIAAAKIQKSLGAEAASTPTQSTSTADVLERAKKLSSGRNDLTGIADDVAAQKSKGGYIDAVSGQYRYR
jgi:hypothetical protein